jgi:hypothetical protein
MAHSDRKRFSIYDDFSSELKSIATQCGMMQGLYNANDFNESPSTLRQFIFAKHKEYEEKLANNQFYSELGKRSLIRDCETLIKSMRSGYWRQRLSGRPVIGAMKFAQLVRMVGCNARVCVHPLFRLINDFELLKTAPHCLTSALSREAKIWLLKKPNDANYLFNDIPQAWKKSYKQQRKKLLTDNSLDSFTVLVLQTIYHQYFLKDEATTFKKLMWQHFKTLFCYRYPLTNIYFLSEKIDALLRHYCSDDTCNILIDTDNNFADFKKQLKDRQQVAYPNLNAVVLSNKNLRHLLINQMYSDASTFQ